MEAPNFLLWKGRSPAPSHCRFWTSHPSAVNTLMPHPMVSAFLLVSVFILHILPQLFSPTHFSSFLLVFVSLPVSVFDCLLFMKQILKAPSSCRTLSLNCFECSPSEIRRNSLDTPMPCLPFHSFWKDLLRSYRCLEYHSTIRKYGKYYYHLNRIGILQLFLFSKHVLLPGFAWHCCLERERAWKMKNMWKNRHTHPQQTSCPRPEIGISAVKGRGRVPGRRREWVCFISGLCWLWLL